MTEPRPSEDLTLKTINDVTALVTGRGDHQAMLWQTAAGEWQPITSDEVYGRIRALADVFRGWGVGKGDRVILLSENRWEWAVTDFAVLALGAVDVPLYATDTAEQIGYMIKDAGAKVLVLSSKDQYEKLTKAGDLPSLEHVVVMDEGEFGIADSFSKLMEDAKGKQARDAEFDEQVASVTPDDLATIIYTSGTTGTPKGVRLTHGNLASNVCVSTTPYGFTNRDSSISFLPLSHATARHADYSLLARGARIAYCPKFNDVTKALKAVKPTIFVGVPRVYEKIRQAVEGKSVESPIKAKLFAWAVEQGKKQAPAVLEGKKPAGLMYAVADKLVFSKIREAFGGCVRTFISGGAPLGSETGNWFAGAGIRIFEGYGLTETSPVIASNHSNAMKMGSVGKLLKNLEVRFAPDGELEVKGPSVFHGYWNRDKETKESLTEDGWFKTGDIANLDENGFLTITDRKKELLKTSGGKLIAPQPIEGKLKANTMIGQAAMVGDKHKFASVLISPNFEALEGWAKGQGVKTSDHAELVKNDKVKAEYQRIVDEVNKSLAPFETMKRSVPVPDEWSVEGGEMTPSMKLKRRVIEEKYKAQIDEFYRDEASSKA